MPQQNGKTGMYSPSISLFHCLKGDCCKEQLSGSLFMLFSYIFPRLDTDFGSGKTSLGLLWMSARRGRLLKVHERFIWAAGMYHLIGAGR